ncbi:hypothetical protein HBI64_233930 [Parastagonospora nodorum]|nr:hypothetical protein HBI64_233930 [Parastagonospora nodorum]
MPIYRFALATAVMLAHRVFVGLRTNTKTSTHLPPIASPFTHLTYDAFKLKSSKFRQHTNQAERWNSPTRGLDSVLLVSCGITQRPVANSTSLISTSTRSSTLNDLCDLT